MVGEIGTHIFIPEYCFLEHFSLIVKEAEVQDVSEVRLDVAEKGQAEDLVLDDADPSGDLGTGESGAAADGDVLRVTVVMRWIVERRHVNVE